jgi:hypothetical protein
MNIDELEAKVAAEEAKAEERCIRPPDTVYRRQTSLACIAMDHDKCVQRWCECRCHDDEVEDQTRPVARFHIG